MADIVLYSILLLLGTAGTFFGFAQFRRARASRHWLQREAVIVHSSIREHRGGRAGTRYSPVVRYQYFHECTVYEGNRFMFSGLELASSYGDVEQFLLPFAEGARITVRVCPVDPRVSVIAAGVDRRLTLLIFASASFIVMGAGGVLGWWH